MDWRTDLERIYSKLWIEISEREFPSISHLENALGLYRGYLRKSRRGARCELRVLLQVLEHLAIDPVKFFGQALGRSGNLRGKDPWSQFEGRARRLVSQARNREFGEFFSNLSSVPADVTTTAAEDPARLDAIDRLKYSDPISACNEAESIFWAMADRGLSPMLIRVAGLLGACLQAASSLDRAHALLWHAREAAHDFPPIFKIEVTLRILHVFAAHRDYENGFNIAEKLVQECANRGHVACLGRSLAMKGTLASCLGKHEQAVAAFEAALRCLPDADAIYRTASLLGIGVDAYHLADFKMAEAYGQQVETYLRDQWPEPSPRRIYGHLAWLRARLAIAQEHDRETERWYRKSISEFERFPVDLAVVTTEWIRYLLQSGDRQRALQTIRELIHISFHLEDIPEADKAISRLIRRAEEQPLTVEYVDEILQQLDRGRAMPESLVRLPQSTGRRGPLVGDAVLPSSERRGRRASSCGVVPISESPLPARYAAGTQYSAETQYSAGTMPGI